MADTGPQMPASGEGHCLCGTVSYRWTAPPLWAMHCHCASCRRHCAAPVVSFFGLADGTWAWTGAEPRVFESSPGVRRSFCPVCGTPMTFAADRYPGETHFYSGTMATPEAYRATAHVHHDERLPWVDLADGLPRHPGSFP